MSASGFPLKLDPSEASPYYRQIYARVRDAVADGRLRPGDRVPSIRGLASALGLARGTVEAAYDLLIGEGYLLPQGQAGTRVAAIGPHAARLGRTRPAAPAAALPGPRSPRPFQLGLPALDAFPHALWSRLIARRLRGATQEDGYPAPAGDPGLREAIAAHLALSRGLRCAPAQVFVTAGYRHTLDLVARTLLRPGDPVWIEDPGFPPTRQLVEAHGARAVAVPVDAEGLCVAEGRRCAARARLAVVTPSHQAPLGVALALPRRLELLAWAAAAEARVLEDDYDGEYRYQGRPLPALASLDREGVVYYAGTFSKVLLPSLRLAYVVVPERDVPRFEATCAAFHGGCPQLVQAVVADFMLEGHLARHVKKMRGLYARRRAAVVEALQAVFGARLRVELQAGGMHLLARLQGRADDRALARAAQRAGLALQALSDWQHEHAVEPGLLLGFTNVADPAAARELAEALRAAWHHSSPRRRGDE
ncbi:MocR-like pyridoxine biosynthesis transcription factor PdxR [Nannocystis punicea]|uniref:PLP-dependent aminotransferase family protein n=1 Tax=Nannocystis punicea TaxID=2995304 RepID=A0ABY7GWN0_9BACT|nr:PLP-dependent aminotransferase family protein [Nannocystis poenicansa]WAS91353.1 PLP-dependent aminotransferase family protein [Nannocystis poenicansa]